MQYYFRGGIEHPVTHSRHGNSKRDDKEYVRTWESTKFFLEKASQEKRPRDAVHHVISENLGGVQFCTGVGQVPRSRQQSSDMKRKRTGNDMEENENRKQKSISRKVDDPWYLLLNLSKKQTLATQKSFVRDVRVGGEPLCVLASDRQLHDLKRFCCDETEFKPFTVDPTFNIGQFNVTPISYQHLLLETRRENNHPTLIGPVLIHERKTEETYSTFASSLKALEPGLTNLMAFGTDDEKALENGFNNNFERATHLLCEIHLKKNLERKLVELGITGNTKDEFISDVFGRLIGDIFESGLTDAANKEEFDSMLNLLKQKWSNAHNNGAVFHEWFIANKAVSFLQSVISPVRQRAGLGCPPERFTTNRSERTNGVIQEFIQQECNGKVDEYVFAVTLQKLVDMQEKEVELAVIGKGEYKIRDRFKHIFVSPSNWVKMTEKQTEAALRKIHTTTVNEKVDSTASAVSRALRDDDNPLMQTFSKACVDWIPRDVLVHIIAKASSLVSKVHVIPDQATPQTTMIVPSSSNPKKPHVIVCFANGKCECQDCPGYSSAFVCAHAIAASIKVNRLEAYLKWLVTTKRKTGGINYSKAITHGMPSGRGRKPNQAPRKRSKSKHPSRDSVTVLPRISPQLVQTVQPNTVDRIAASSPSCSTLVAPPHLFPNQQAAQESSSQYAFSSSCPVYPTIPIQSRVADYPSPQPDTFMIYLLGMCSPLTSLCFGCRNTLKPGGFIGIPPADLVIVSMMVRSWPHEGQLHSGLRNVYFHCVPTCVQKKQPYFQPPHAIIPCT